MMLAVVLLIGLLVSMLAGFGFVVVMMEGE